MIKDEINFKEAKATYEIIRQRLIDSQPKPESKVKRFFKIVIAVILFIISIPVAWVLAYLFAWALEQQL